MALSWPVFSPNAAVKNEWNYTSIPHDVYKENCPSPCYPSFRNLLSFAVKSVGLINKVCKIRYLLFIYYKIRCVWKLIWYSGGDWEEVCIEMRSVMEVTFRILVFWVVTLCSVICGCNVLQWRVPPHLEDCGSVSIANLDTYQLDYTVP